MSLRLLEGAPVIEVAKQEQRIACELLNPSLAVVLAVSGGRVDPGAQSYVNRKVKYGREIGANVDVHKLSQAEISGAIDELNKDSAVDGIILELPLPDPKQTDELCAAILPRKDVDGLHPQSLHSPATPRGIMRLLSGYDIGVAEEVVTVNGALGNVGRGTVKLMEEAGAEVVKIDKHNNGDLADAVRASKVLVTAVGRAGLIPASLVDKEGLVVIDAGVSQGATGTVGDVAPGAYDLDTNIFITPHRGGVGAMTGCAIFDGLLKAAQMQRELTGSRA